MNDDLLQAALAVRLNAYAPYSAFRVGAALRAASGRVYSGCNVENVSFSLTICAESAAIAAMIAAGDTDIVDLVVVAEGPKPIAPCGGCRQKIAEFGAADLPVTLATVDGETQVIAFDTLLPMAFGPSHMGLT